MICMRIYYMIHIIHAKNDFFLFLNRQIFQNIVSALQNYLRIFYAAIRKVL
jgi:hypothetical protein